VTNFLHGEDAAGPGRLVVVVGADERENAWLGEGLAEQAAVSGAGAKGARGLRVVGGEGVGVGVR
jgi:DNA excision repair protein ERCC-4